MIFTPDHDLPCLSPTDYAAYAVYMKCLAQQLEDELSTRLDGFAEFQRRPSARWVNTVVQNFAVGTTTELNVPTLDFITTNWPGTAPTAPTLGNLRGWWWVGANTGMVASGGVTADTIRRMTLNVEPPIGSPAATPDTVFTDVAYESNTAGEWLMAGGLVYTTGSDVSIASDAGGRIRMFGFANNASSINTIPATIPTTIWATYVGDTPEIVAVT